MKITANGNSLSELRLRECGCPASPETDRVEHETCRQSDVLKTTGGALSISTLEFLSGILPSRRLQRLDPVPVWRCTNAQKKCFLCRPSLHHLAELIEIDGLGRVLMCPESLGSLGGMSAWVCGSSLHKLQTMPTSTAGADDPALPMSASILLTSNRAGVHGTQKLRALGRVGSEDMASALELSQFIE